MSTSLSSNATTTSEQPAILLATQETVRQPDAPPYIYHTVTVAPNATRVNVRLVYRKQDRRDGMFFIALFDAEGRFRGMRMNPGAQGDVELILWSTPQDASEGALTGPIPAGEWRVLVDVYQLATELAYELEVTADYGSPTPHEELAFPDNHVTKAESGWYKGELHAHSTESDGKYPVETVIQAAIDAGLDFFSLTDHFTVSQWRKLLPFVGDRLALLRSCELTSHHGHANLQGIRAWVNGYVDEPDWTMNDAADATHAQGGLFCVNHPFSGVLGWRAYDFDWDKADLLEVFHNLEGPNNNLQTPLWDRLLNAGHRIVGVGGIDSHDPFEGLHALGQLVTYVYMDELSERGLIQGLHRGRVFVTRGPELRFSATNVQGDTATMWEGLLVHAAPAELQVEIKTSENVNVFLIRDGLPFEMVSVEAGEEWQTLQWYDQPSRRAYYRVEVHAPNQGEQYKGIQWRDFTTFRALTNPIWLEANDKRGA